MPPHILHLCYLMLAITGAALAAFVAWRVAGRPGDARSSFAFVRNFALTTTSAAVRRRDHWRPFANPSNGNVAFEEWRIAELKRLENERRKLEEVQNEFLGYVEALRLAKDRDEFARFERSRPQRAPLPSV